MTDFFHAVKLAQAFVGEVLKPGGQAVDATAGNGHDTLFLARLVDPGGRVYAFDIQAAALQNTARRLAASDLTGIVRLIQAGHQQLLDYVQAPLQGLMFNLGYLPGGSHTVITRTEDTLTALKAGLGLLAVGGRASLVLYPGHPGGDREALAIEAFVAGLASRAYRTACLKYTNRVSNAPVLIMIEKIAGKASGLDEDQETEKNS